MDVGVLALAAENENPPPNAGHFLLALFLRVEVIQRLIHRQLAEHDHLRNPQHRAALEPSSNAAKPLDMNIINDHREQARSYVWTRPPLSTRF